MNNSKTFWVWPKVVLSFTQASTITTWSFRQKNNWDLIGGSWVLVMITWDVFSFPVVFEWFVPIELWNYTNWNITCSKAIRLTCGFYALLCTTYCFLWYFKNTTQSVKNVLFRKIYLVSFKYTPFICHHWLLSKANAKNYKCYIKQSFKASVGPIY